MQTLVNIKNGKLVWLEEEKVEKFLKKNEGFKRMVYFPDRWRTIYQNNLFHGITTYIGQCLDDHYDGLEMGLGGAKNCIKACFIPFIYKSETEFKNFFKVVDKYKWDTDYRKKVDNFAEMVHTSTLGKKQFILLMELIKKMTAKEPDIFPLPENEDGYVFQFMISPLQDIKNLILQDN